MEQMFAIEHPSHQTLASLWSEDLPAAATESILAHLESCAECEQHLAAIDSSIEHYRRLVKLVDGHLPDAPHAWADIWVEMERMDRRVRPVTMRPVKASIVRPIWIGAIAAAILLGLLIWPRGHSVVRAETLLVHAKASADRVHSRKRPHLRVLTGHALFVRPAVLAGDRPENETLRAQFRTARYDWSDPLSAAAFRSWREQLRQKTDRLSETSEPVQYRLQTTTTDNALRDASIVFEGPDLTPVSLRLVFDGGGWVEITAIPETPAAVSTVLNPSLGNAPPVPEPRITDRQLAEHELSVRLAIDALSNNAPAPVTVEVAREGSIIVTPYHLSPEQVRQLSESLSGKEGVLLNPVEGGVGPTGFLSAGDEAPAISTAGITASLAHLLAEDADRFPVAREVLLEPTGRAALRDLRIRRTERLISQLDKLNNQLAATHELTGPGDFPVASRETPPSLAGLEQAAGTLNRLVTAVYATGADHMEASVAWPELTREMGEVRRLARQYERYLKLPEERK